MSTITVAGNLAKSFDEALQDDGSYDNGVAERGTMKDDNGDYPPCWWNFRIWSKSEVEKIRKMNTKKGSGVLITGKYGEWRGKDGVVRKKIIDAQIIEYLPGGKKDKQSGDDRPAPAAPEKDPWD